MCIGRLTNIATPVVKERAFAHNVKALHVMGGSNNARGNITAAAEFNFYVDPESAKAVLAVGTAIVAGLDSKNPGADRPTFERGSWNRFLASGRAGLL